MPEELTAEELEELTEEQRDYIEKVVSLFIIAYAGRLIAGHGARIIKTVREELPIIKSVQKKAGVEITDFKPGDISGWSASEVEFYRRMLLDYGGTYIVKNGILEFKDWMRDLQPALIESAEKVIIRAKQFGYTPQVLREELLKALGNEYNNRLYVSAYVESRVIEDRTKRELYADTGINYVVWYTQKDSRVRPTHQERQGKIYLLAECPSLGEPGCRCWIYPYTSKNSLMISTGGPE